MAAAGFDAIFGLLKVAVVLLVIGTGIWAYTHSHTDEFKLRCAGQKLGFRQLDFPDNVLCDVFYERKY